MSQNTDLKSSGADASTTPAAASSPRADPLPPAPEAAYAEFGAVEVKPLSRLQLLASGILTRNWTMIPHVTQHDEADITDLERERAAHAGDAIKLTLLPFIIRAAVKALQAFPQFNVSLDATGKSLVLKKYFNLGVAVDTKFGLLVPVLRNCERKSIAELAEELAAISQKARTKGLGLAEMSGGCFTISSLGALGGTGFTPIINAPEVAILGVSRTQTRPTQAPDGGIAWRHMLPLSLSYDHRVVNGADAARFTTYLAQALAEPLAGAS